MYKKLNTDILRRYIDGKATDLEKTEVEKWIKDTSFDSVENIFVSDEEKDRIKSDIWLSLEKQSRPYFTKRTTFRCNRKILYAISSAACIAGVITFLSPIFYSKNQPILENQLSEKTVRFCQNTKLNVNENTKVTFIADCSNGEVVQQTVLCKKGETYFAIKSHSDADSEIFVVTQRDLQELPRDIRIALHKESLL